MAQLSCTGRDQHGVSWLHCIGFNTDERPLRARWRCSCDRPLAVALVSKLQEASSHEVACRTGLVVAAFAQESQVNRELLLEAGLLEALKTCIVHSSENHLWAAALVNMTMAVGAQSYSEGALRTLKDMEVVPALASMLSAGSRLTQLLAGHALRLWAQGLQSGSSAIAIDKRKIAKMVGLIDASVYTGLLEKALHDASEDMQVTALTALRWICTMDGHSQPRAIAPLLTLVSDGNKRRVVIAAVKLLSTELRHSDGTELHSGILSLSMPVVADTVKHGGISILIECGQCLKNDDDAARCIYSVLYVCIGHVGAIAATEHKDLMAFLRQDLQKVTEAVERDARTPEYCNALLLTLLYLADHVDAANTMRRLGMLSQAMALSSSLDIGSTSRSMAENLCGKLKKAGQQSFRRLIHQLDKAADPNNYWNSCLRSNSESGRDDAHVGG